MLSKLNPVDLPEAIELLKYWNLPYDDLSNPVVQLYCMKDKDGLKGTGGLEIYGENALIRSVAIKEESKGQGIGRIICDQLEQIAAKSRVKMLYLLTTSAASFFERRGYEIIKREQFPETLKNTSQFSELCPVSAICMMKLI